MSEEKSECHYDELRDEESTHHSDDLGFHDEELELGQFKRILSFSHHPSQQNNSELSHIRRQSISAEDNLSLSPPTSPVRTRHGLTHEPNIIVKLENENNETNETKMDDDNSEDIDDGNEDSDLTMEEEMSHERYMPQTGSHIEPNDHDDAQLVRQIRYLKKRVSDLQTDKSQLQTKLQNIQSDVTKEKRKTRRNKQNVQKYKHKAKQLPHGSSSRASKARDAKSIAQQITSKELLRKVVKACGPMGKEFIQDIRDQFKNEIKKQVAKIQRDHGYQMHNAILYCFNNVARTAYISLTRKFGKIYLEQEGQKLVCVDLMGIKQLSMVSCVRL
eukprot:215277_1